MAASSDDITIALVLLSLDEVAGVTALLPQLTTPSALGVDRVVAVDGGSTDGTLEAYAAHGVTVLPGRSRGRGEAMRMAATALDTTHLIFFSPDGNEDWRDIAKFRGYFAAGFDLVIASRMMAGARNEEDDARFRPRKWANLAFNRLANVFFRGPGQPLITDSINGFRGVGRRALLELATDAVGYTVEYQMTMRALERGLLIAEFPTQEGQRIGGTTKAKAVPTGLRFVRCLGDELRRRR